MRKRKNLVFPRVPLSYSVPLLIVCIAVFFVLLSWYLGGITNIMLQAVPVNVINVTSCGTLSQNNAYYVLNSSLSFTTSNCITIQGDNVTLDGEFKHLITSSAPYSYTASAVLSLGKNVTIQRLNITVPVSRGIVIYGSNSVVNSNVIKDAYVAAVIGAAATPSGVIFSNNVINRAYIGISIWDATKVEILDNTISNTNNSVDIGLFGGQSILLKNLNIINQSPLTNSLTITDAVANGNVPGPPNFIDIVDSSFTSYQIANAFTTFTSTGKGEINFTQPISGGVMTQGVSGRNLNDDVKIEYNYAYVNSTRAGLNVPARITFEGLPTNLVNPVMLRNGLSCPANICTNLTSLNAGTVVFNVTGWTNYSISSVINPNNNSSNNNTYSNISINEPDSGDLYTVLDFPVVFDVNLSMNGSVKFSLNGGVANITMNTLNRRTFTYSQSLLLIGNYTFTAYANFSNGVNESLSVDFRVVDIVPTMSINEHSPDDSYALSAFPVTFNISLNLNGSVNFSLNNGVTNTTMNTTNNRLFTYSQGLLPVGNYVLTAYSNFLNGAKRNATVNFVVVNNPNNPGGSSGGSGGGGGRRSTTGIARNNSNISY